MTQTATKNPIIAPDFAHRLNVACDNNDLVPPYNYGRQTWVANQLEKLHDIKVSKETVRKWFAGEARPRTDKMKALATVLRVDEAWLSLGTRPDLGVEDRKLRTLATEGAIHLLVGYFTMNGANCAFLEPGDVKAERAHFYSIIGGRAYEVFVSVGQKTREGYKFTAPNGFESSLCLGVVQRGPFQFDIYRLTNPAISKYGTKRGGFVDVSATEKGGEVRVKDEVLWKLNSLEDLRR